MLLTVVMVTLLFDDFVSIHSGPVSKLQSDIYDPVSYIMVTGVIPLLVCAHITS